MKMRGLKIPDGDNFELYLDRSRLEIGFREAMKKGIKQKNNRPHILHVVVQCFGTIIEDRCFSPGSIITIGSDKKNTFQVPTQGLGGTHELITYASDRKIQIHVDDSFDGIVQTERKR